MLDRVPPHLNAALARVRDHVSGDAAVALRAQRVSGRLTRLAETPVLSPEQAELCNLNQLVLSAVEEVMPLCRATGSWVTVLQDPLLPTVPVLRGPIEDALSAALDLLVFDSPEPSRIHVRTMTTRASSRAPGPGRHRAVVTVEHHVHDAASHRVPWRDLGLAGQIELLVGDSATRAMGGRLRLQGRCQRLRLQLELPITDRPMHAARAWREVPDFVAPAGFGYELPPAFRTPAIGEPAA